VVCPFSHPRAVSATPELSALCAGPGTPASRGGWYVGWRLEDSIDPTERDVLQRMLASSDGGLPHGLDIPVMVALFKKMYAATNAVSAYADQFAREAQGDMPQLRRRNEQLEHMLFETNVHTSSLVDAGAMQATAAADRLVEADRSRRVDDALRRDKDAFELVRLRKYHLTTQGVFRFLKEALQCPICGDVAMLPKVLGACGHIACQSCLQQLDDMAFAQLTSSIGGASARQHLLARRCPLCRSEIIGSAFPCHPLREVAALLVGSDCVEVENHAAIREQVEKKLVKYEPETGEQQHIAALQLGCYAQSQLAIHSVNTLEVTINAEQWKRGVYIVFEHSVSRVFFETFATTLQGRAGGVKVFVNASRRMLAVHLIDPTKDKSDKSVGPHLLIRVGTDGRYTVTAAPDPRTTPTVMAPPALAPLTATTAAAITSPMSSEFHASAGTASSWSLEMSSGASSGMSSGPRSGAMSDASYSTAHSGEGFVSVAGIAGIAVVPLSDARAAVAAAVSGAANPYALATRHTMTPGR
jgi:RING-type zinc-finger